jgi:hypothetical protein
MVFQSYVCNSSTGSRKDIRGIGYYFRMTVTTARFFGINAWTANAINAFADIKSVTVNTAIFFGINAWTVNAIYAFANIKSEEQ